MMKKLFIMKWVFSILIPLSVTFGDYTTGTNRNYKKALRLSDKAEYFSTDVKIISSPNNRLLAIVLLKELSDEIDEVFFLSSEEPQDLNTSRRFRAEIFVEKDRIYIKDVHINGDLNQFTVKDDAFKGSDFRKNKIFHGYSLARYKGLWSLDIFENEYGLEGNDVMKILTKSEVEDSYLMQLKEENIEEGPIGCSTGGCGYDNCSISWGTTNCSVTCGEGYTACCNFVGGCNCVQTEQLDCIIRN